MVKNGMVGGVTAITRARSPCPAIKSTETLMENVSKVSDLLSNAKAQKLSADSTWFETWADGRTDVEKLSYNGGSKSVAADRTCRSSYRATATLAAWRATTRRPVS